MFRRINRFLTPLNDLRKRLLLDERGAVMVFLAIAAIPLIGFVGIGTDVARAYLVKSRLSSALDAAGLAGGQSFFLPTRNADIDMFFQANFPTNYMGATVTGPTKIIDEANETIQLHASADIPTSFMHLIGYNSLSVDASAEVVRNMMGATNPRSAAPGTIRGDLGILFTENLVHGSDSLESAQREIGIFFPNL